MEYPGGGGCRYAGRNGVWSFSDGLKITNQPYASRTWASPGIYQVSLTAYNDTNPDGVTTTTTVSMLPKSRAGGRQPGGAFALSTDASDTNSQYRLQSKTNLAQPAWQVIDAWFSGNGSNLILSDPGATNGQRFYRLESMGR